MTSTTQRTLLILRHAKAAEDEQGGDHTRPLAPRGLEDAFALGQWLAEENRLPELVMCSSATRTRQTLGQICDGAERNLPTLLRDKLYLASAGDMLAQLQNADDEVQHLAVLGHNPGVHGLLALLAGEYMNDHDMERVAMKFPTAACAVLHFTLESWRDLAPQAGRLDHFRWPAEN